MADDVAPTAIGIKIDDALPCQAAGDGQSPRGVAGVLMGNESREEYLLRRRWFHNQMSPAKVETQADVVKDALEIRQHSRLNEFGHSEDRDEYRRRRFWYLQKSTELNDVTPKLASGGDTTGSYRSLARACLTMILSLCVWFSANVSLPEIAAEYQLPAKHASLLTVVVNVGFTVGATASSVLQLPDRVLVSRLVALGSFAGAICNAVMASPWPLPFTTLLLARFLNGVAISFIYPVLMRHVSSWFTLARRGLALGCLVGSLVLGIAVPSLLRALLPTTPWRGVVLTTSLLALIAVFLAVFMRDGPYLKSQAKFSIKAVFHILRSRSWILVTLSYIGHNLELFAGWAWIGSFLQEYFEERFGADPSVKQVGPLAGFAVIAVGCFGCIAGGLLSDRIGRQCTIILAHIVSGTSLAILPYASHWGAPPAVVLLLAGVWGFAAIADSAQYSALISELLKETGLLGTALSMSLALGFTSTSVGIYVVPILFEWGGWERAFLCVSFGPLAGILCILALSLLREARL